MKVEILTIGDELLLGFTVDSNSAFLSRQLADMGIEVVRHTTVGDVSEEIVAAVNSAMERTGALITSGGMGPTSDDISVSAVATTFGRELVEDAATIARLEGLIRARGYSSPLTSSNRRQALVPRGATVLVNRHGSAPGIWIEEEGRGWVAMLPGVPRELKGLFADEVRPRLVSLAGRDAVVASRTLRTTGIAEAALAELVLRSDLRVHNLAYLPGARGVDLRVTVRGLSRDAADRLLRDDIEKLRSVVGERAYGEDVVDLAEVVLQLALAGSITLAVAESCTGGMLGARLTAIPGSSRLFSGGVIAYADEAKRRLLGVKQATLDAWGAVSEATAQEMATGVRHSLAAGCGIAITGIAGPTGGSAVKPVGTVCVAIELEGNSRAVSRVLPGDRDEIRQRACQMALDLTRVELLRRNTVR